MQMIRQLLTMTALAAMTLLAAPAIAATTAEAYALVNQSYVERFPGKAAPFVVPEGEIGLTFGTDTIKQLIDKGCKRVPGTPSDAAYQAAIAMLNDEFKAHKRFTRWELDFQTRRDSFVITAAQLWTGCPGAIVPPSSGGSFDPASWAKGYNDAMDAVAAFAAKSKR